MTREEAIQILKDKKLDFTIPICREQKIATFEPIRSVFEHNEAIDMAISALQAEVKEHQLKVGAVADGIVGYETIKKSAERYKTEPSDLISRADAIVAVCKWCEHPYCESKEKCGQWIAMTILPSAELPKGDMISRADAVEAVQDVDTRETVSVSEAVKAINALPSADAVSEDTQTEERARFVAKETELAHIEARLENAEKRLQELPKYTNCTEFIEWLTEVVLDDEDWELNAVAYGEIICRKLKKLGVLDTKDGYYIRTPLAYDDRPSGEWIWCGDKGDSRYMCSVCKCKENVPTCMGEPTIWDYCPSCGAKMKGGDDE